MSMTYLDTFGVVIASGTDGVAYATLTRAMKVHVRSLHTEGVVAAFVGDETVGLDAAGAVVCLTLQGEAYADLLAESGLLQPRETLQEQGPSKPKSTKVRRRKATSKRRRTVPTPSESVSPVNPEGRRMVPGNSLGDQMAPVQGSSEEDRVAALERKVSALLAVLAS